jgi:hypothetical protein
MNNAMRKPARTLLMGIMLLFAAMPQQANAQSGGKGQGTVYLIRRTGVMGALDGYSIFMDGQRICVLNNKKYSVHQVPAGEHRFNVRFDGKTEKANKEPLVLQIEAGREYYINVLQREGFTSKVTLQELAGSSGKRALEGVSRDDSCR